jgi:1-acyl-sn-glycerol-3-phosphate acyltransferase
MFVFGYLFIKRNHVEKNDDGDASTIVCNHLSMVDIIYLISEFGFVSFLARVFINI